ncbi:MAG: chromate transporter [Clostridia bacterium]|nr:chromate transporter [Clostridia bacterium]
MKKLWELFITFFKIGAFTFGGGYAMIPLIQKEVVENKNWVSDEDILDIVAIAESTPGPIAINSATFIGFKTAGVKGSFLATLGVVLPSFVIISVIAYLLTEFADIKWVQYAFFGIRAGVLALVTKSLCTMYKKAPKGLIAYIITLLAFVLVAFAGINALTVIALSAVIGLIVSEIKIRRSKQ